MESFHFQIEQNINKILADFHENEDLSSNNIPNLPTKENNMVVFF